MSEVQDQLLEVNKSLQKIQILSKKIKRHTLQRQNTLKQVKTISKFISLEEFINRRLSLLSKTETNIHVLTQLKTQVDDLQIKIETFESSLDDEYWKRYQEMQFNNFKINDLQFLAKADENNRVSITVEQDLSTTESLKTEQFGAKTCKCEIF